MMRLDKSGIVLVIGCHEHHYALLEADPKKTKVIIWESTKFETTSSAAAFWMECITIILRRHWPDELEDDCSNVLPLGMKIKKNAKKKNKKKIWWVQYNVGYLQEGEDECGAVAFNQLAWRLNALTESQNTKDLCAFIKDPHKLKAGNRENAYQIVCHLIKSQRKEKIWLKMEGDNDESEESQEKKEDNAVGNVICKKTAEEGKNDVGRDDYSKIREEGKKDDDVEPEEGKKDDEVEREEGKKDDEVEREEGKKDDEVEREEGKKEKWQILWSH
jgi:hypothetical protein